MTIEAIIGNIWNYIPPLITILAVLFTFAIGIAWIMRKFGIAKAGKNGVELTAELKKETEALYLQNRILKDVVQKVDKIEYQTTLSKQMSVVDREVDRSISKMREVHLDLVIEILGDEAGRKHDCIEAYANITEIVRSRMIDRFRLFMRDNGFDEMTELEFQAYVMRKLEEIYGYIEHIVDNGYKHDVVGVKQLRERQRQFAHVYGQMIQTVFIEAREIKRNAVNDVNKLHEKYAKIQKHYATTGEIIEIQGDI